MKPQASIFEELGTSERHCLTTSERDFGDRLSSREAPKFRRCTNGETGCRVSAGSFYVTLKAHLRQPHSTKLKLICTENELGEVQWISDVDLRSRLGTAYWSRLALSEPNTGKEPQRRALWVNATKTNVRVTRQMHEYLAVGRRGVKTT